jgi:tRNA (mo5U34)-methyltransferase
MTSETFSYVRNWRAEFQTKGWWHSFELPDGRRIDGVCKLEGLRERIQQFPIPEDLRGARVLDVGSWDGWYSFEMERRGADVLAVDCWNNPRFHQMKAALNSRVEFRQLDVYELTPDRVGQFDIVLFMGVLYHLKHPLLALERICSVTKRLAAVDSFVLKEGHRPGENVENRAVMEFFETDEFGGQTDNWCGPSLPCLMAMCRTAGSARVEHRATLVSGACVACHRIWEPSQAPDAPVPELIGAAHHINFGINFDTRSDEYVWATIRIPEGDVNPEQIEPQVGEFGVRPIHVSRVEGEVWQVNFKLPPGIPAGWQDVTVRLAGGPPSNAMRIAVDLPLRLSEIRIREVTDAATYEAGVLNMASGNALSVWISGLPENADRQNVRSLLGGELLPVSYVSELDGREPRQVNVEVPEEVPSGHFELEIQVGVRRSNSVTVEIKR